MLVNGAWGFSSSANLDLDEAERIAREAVEIAAASGIAGGPPVELDDTEPVTDTYRTPLEEDPFAVSLDDKLAILMEADAAHGRVPGVAIREGNMVAGRERKTFASTAGAWIEQEIVEAGGGIEATAVNESEMQQRSYPNSFGGQVVTGGFEAVRALGLADHAQETAELAVALLDAPQCPSGEMDLILDSTQVALQIHESCGHPTELDRVFGTEASFAGTSFLTTDKLDQLRYGSDRSTSTPTRPRPAASARSATTTRACRRRTCRSSTAARSSATSPAARRRRASAAAAWAARRAWMWSNIPLIRMTNINLRPGDAGTLEDLIADTRDGIFMSVNKSWSIDDRRLNFQFGDQAGWLIKNGKRTQLVKNPTYTGITPEFWGSCDAICGPDEWTLWGCRTAARASRCRSATSATARRRPASAA